MRALKLGQNSAVFVIFFGLALIEAVRHGDWVVSLVYVALGFVFLWSDGRQAGAMRTGSRNV